MAFQIRVMKMNNNIKKIDEIIGNSESIAIVGHIRPDGDCVGAALGLYNYIIDNFQGIDDIQVYLMKPLPGIFNFMRGYDKVEWMVDDNKTYDLCICVDCGEESRLEGSFNYFESAKRTFCIDHHLNYSNFATDSYVDSTAAATCELIVDILDVDKISKECAECLFTGIVTDTGVFKFNSTSKKTMAIAGILMDKGIDFSSIIDTTFFEKTYAQNQILGKVLLESKFACGNKCLVGVVTKDDMDLYGLEARHLDGIVNNLLNTRGVEAAIFIYELDKSSYKASVRSKSYVNVVDVVKPYGGGGHFHAAGVTLKNMTLDEAIDALTADIEKQINTEN